MTKSTKLTRFFSGKFLLSPADMQELMDVRRSREKNLADFQAFFAASDALLKPAANALTDADVVRLVNEAR